MQTEDSKKLSGVWGNENQVQSILDAFPNAIEVQINDLPDDGPFFDIKEILITFDTGITARFIVKSISTEQGSFYNISQDLNY